MMIIPPLRGRIVRELRQDESVKNVHTYEGKILCYKDGGDGKDTRIVINSPDDLLAVGWSEDKIKSVGGYLDL